MLCTIEFYRRPALLMAFLLAASISGTNETAALGPGSCQAYADEAVKQAKSMQASKCGYLGDGWSTDRNVHLRECRRWTSEDTPKDRNNARSGALGRCSQCGLYASAASNLGRENNRFTCGGEGANFSVLFQDHYNYCQATWDKELDYLGNAALAAEKERDRVIVPCKNKFSSEQIATCHNYSEKASSQAVWNFQNRCGDAKEGIQGRWTWNGDSHFAFCTAGFRSDPEGKLLLTKLKEEEEARAGRNAWCQPNLVLQKKNPKVLYPIPSQGPSPFGGGRESQTRSKNSTRAAKPREPEAKGIRRASPASSSTAIDRLSGSSPQVGGSYQSRESSPRPSQSSPSSGDRAGDQSIWSGNSLKTAPATGNMGVGTREPAWKGSVR
jgi:hypothetical protein